MPETITANPPSGSYDIVIGQQVLNSIPNHISSLDPSPNHLILVTDGNVEQHWQKPVLELIQPLTAEKSRYVIPPGEQSKSRDELARIWRKMLKKRADRSSVVIALGGGVVGDLAGFAAATYMRGVRLVHVPTSLLAQVDSCIGGKVGINFSSTKNVVGAFYQPELCLISLDTLMTLPDREYQEGLAEVIKYGLILDSSFLEWIENHTQEILNRNPDVLQPLVRRSVECKVEVVENDEKEAGLRQILNFGHTIGHCIEATTSSDQYLHGEAIAPGMLAAIDLSERIDLLEEHDLFERVSRLFDRFGLPSVVKGVTFDEMKPHLKRDKKAKKGEPRWVLIRSAGDVEYGHTVSEDLVRASLARIQASST